MAGMVRYGWRVKVCPVAAWHGRQGQSGQVLVRMDRQGVAGSAQSKPPNA